MRCRPYEREIANTRIGGARLRLCSIAATGARYASGFAVLLLGLYSGTTTLSVTASPNHFFKFRSSSINFTVNAAPAVTVADGATVEIDGVSAQSVTFLGTTGTLRAR